MAAVGQNAGANSPVRKKQQMMMIGLGGILLLIALSVAFVGSGNQPLPPTSNSAAEVKKAFGDPTPKVNQQELWRTQESARVQGLQEDMAGLKKLLEDERKAQTEERTRLAIEDEKKASDDRVRRTTTPPVAALPQLPPQPGQPTQRNVGSLPPPPGSFVAQGPILPGTFGQQGSAGQGNIGMPMTPQGEPIRGILRIDLTDSKSKSGTVPSSTSASTNEVALATQKSNRSAVNYIPAGSFLRAINLTGIDAPTGGQAQSNPHPLLFRVVDFAQLPNNFKADYKECFITAAGHGDISSERAMVRLDKLSCISKDGGAVDADIKGYVSDETGKNGMKGRLVSKQGQVIANAILAGVASGIGSAFSNSSTTSTQTALGTTQSVNPSESLKYGLGQGANKGFDRLAQYYITLADKLHPVVEVDSGRQVDIVFLQGVTMEKAR